MFKNLVMFVGFWLQSFKFISHRLHKSKSSWAEKHFEQEISLSCFYLLRLRSSHAFFLFGGPPNLSWLFFYFPVKREEVNIYMSIFCGQHSKAKDRVTTRLDNQNASFPRVPGLSGAPWRVPFGAVWSGRNKHGRRRNNLGIFSRDFEWIPEGWEDRRDVTRFALDIR